MPIRRVRCLWSVHAVNQKWKHLENIIRFSHVKPISQNSNQIGFNISPLNKQGFVKKLKGFMNIKSSFSTHLFPAFIYGCIIPSYLYLLSVTSEKVLWVQTMRSCASFTWICWIKHKLCWLSWASGVGRSSSICGPLYKEGTLSVHVLMLRF